MVVATPNTVVAQRSPVGHALHGDRDVAPTREVRMNRSGLLAAILLCAAIAACSYARHAEVRDLAADEDGTLRSAAGVEFDGYTKTDGIYYRYKGYVRLDGADSLRFSPIPFEQEGKSQDPAPPGSDRFTLPVSEVKSINLD
jgi:hypothetical protein